MFIITKDVFGCKYYLQYYKPKTTEEGKYIWNGLIENAFKFDKTEATDIANGLFRKYGERNVSVKLANKI